MCAEISLQIVPFVVFFFFSVFLLSEANLSTTGIVMIADFISDN